MHQNDSAVAVGDFLAHERVSLELAGETGRSAAANTARNPAAIPIGTKGASNNTFHTAIGGKTSSVMMAKSSIPASLLA